MSNLPILSNSAPSNGKIAANNTGNSTNAAADSPAQPFGELLAKQLGGKHGETGKADLLKRTPASEVAALIAAALKEAGSADLSTEAAVGDLLKISAAPAADTNSDAIPLAADLLATLPARGDAQQAISGTDASAALPAKSAVRNDAASIAAEEQSARTGRSTDIRDAATAAVERASTAIERADAKTAAATFAAALKGQDERGADMRLSAATGKGDAVVPTLQTHGSAITGAGGTLPAQSPASLPAQATVTTPLGQPRWAEDFSQKVTWLTTQRNQSAELHLNPQQLGPLEISLKLNGDQATLQFTSAHSAVREAIEQSIPRLRDMLADSGITLGNTTVSDQAQREQQRRDTAQAADDNNGNVENDAEPELHVTHTTPLRRHDGMVDTFA